MQIWLEANQQAHDFVPPDYWRNHYAEVSRLLPQAEVHVLEEGGEILGFIGLDGEYVAGLFVRRDARGRGVGRALLAHARRTHRCLTLQVYRENSRAVAFYEREGFHIQSEQTDESTGCTELLMEWRA
ncbi:GNAT family N-acetyltransferase [Feifania hominis]|nr:GNAT family N-acetyltransferase [Feifania hominis]